MPVLLSPDERYPRIRPLSGNQLPQDHVSTAPRQQLLQGVRSRLEPESLTELEICGVDFLLDLVRADEVQFLVQVIGLH
jgi:hypothetical protein